MEIMHRIKKYANGRLYDSTSKKYITMEELEDFVRTGVIFTVVVSKTDEDITDSVIAKVKEDMKSESLKKTENKPKIKPKVKPKIQARKQSRPKVKAESQSAEPRSILSQLLLKGGETFTGCARGYGDLWHSAMTLAEEELDKRIKQLVRAKEVSESEAGRMKKEIIGFVKNLKNWLGENVEERIHSIISTMNLATRNQVDELAEKIDDLNLKLAMMERIESEREDSPEGIVNFEIKKDG
jgi:polyhydroxyalkanoate synthesis regulator phasin